MFSATLTTERLVLRPPRVEDAPVLYERYASDPQATRFLSWKTHESIEDTRTFLGTIVPPPAGTNDQHWVLCADNKDTPCGMLTTFGGGNAVALGYVLARPLWGRGLMPEALRALAAEVWRNPKIWRLQALAHVDNVGSHRVLEKCGLRLEGILRRRFVIPSFGEAPQDCRLYAQVRDDLA